MARRLLMFLMLVIVGSAAAQKQPARTAARTKTQTTQQRKTTPRKQQTATKPAAKKPTKQQLQAQQQQLKKDIAANKRQKSQLEQKVKQQLEDAFTLGAAIDEQKRIIDTIRVGLDSIERQMAQLNAEKKKLEGELHERQQRYASSVRYMHRNRKLQSRMMFILSAKNINQMYRRTRFMDEYSTYQRAQGEAVRQKQAQVEQKQQEIALVRDARKAMLARQERERQTLQQQQEQKQQMARELQKQQRTVTDLIARQQQQESQLNAQIDRLVAEEIAREQERQARLEAERRRKAEEQARLEQQQRSNSPTREQKREQRQEKKQDKAIEKQVRRETKEMAREERRTSGTAGTEHYQAADPDAHLTGSFTSNKGRLPMPISGAYQLVRGFGDNVVDGARGVHLTSKGIYLKGQPGAQARCVFDGEVSKIFSTGSTYIVMVRHGRYISVYSDLASVSVSAGQKVSTSQTLGRLGGNCIMQFQLRNWTELLNPRLWLRR